ncbi:MAG: hypothetical protein ACLQGP_10995 [Isosphaeraceae bacterium]
MSWTKRGLIYVPDGRFGWNRTHAAVPTVDAADDQVWRIYYAARDEDNRSHTSYLDVEAGNPSRILYEHPEPILPLGRLGTFDDSGIMPSWVVAVDRTTRYLYYIGWTVRQTVPYHNSIGLAISNDGGRTFTKAAEGPLFGLTLHEPYFTGTSCVLIDEGTWKNWYLSCVGWEEVEGRAEPLYNIKYAESPDGIHWRRDGVVAIELKLPDEGGIAKAAVLRGADCYHMWYSYRKLSGYRSNKKDSYRIGYAESADGVRWERKDHLAGIDISAEGWDANMIAYPHVIDWRGRRFLFYNGNGFGKSGFGYATRDSTGEETPGGDS